MKIREIYLQNIKGITDRIDLDSKSAFITGDNMAGKTAITDAVELALLGSHSIGKSGAALAKFASSADMIAQVTFQDGTKSTLEVNAVKPIKVKHKPAIDVPDFLIRPSAFRSMKKADQVAHVAELIGNTMSASEVHGIMEEVLEGTGNKEIVNQYKEATSLADEPVDFDLPGAIPAVIKDLDKIRQHENSLALDLEKKAATTAPGEPISEDMIAILESKRAALVARIDGLGTKVSEMTLAHATFNNATIERERLYQALTAADEAPEADQQKLAQAKADLAVYRTEASDAIRIIRESRGGRDALVAILDTIDQPGPCPVCQNEAPNWRQTARDTIQAKIDSIDVQGATLAARLEETKVLGRAAADLVAKLETPAPDLAKVQKRIEEIDAMNPPEGDPVVLRQEKTDLASTIDASGLEIAHLTHQRQTRIAIRQAGDQAAIHRGAASLAKAMIDAIEVKDQERVEAKIGRILERANLVAGGILPGPLSWDRGGLSYTSRDGARIDADTWSGTEDLLGRIAWSTAIASDSPLGLVILDEFGRLSWANQTKVLVHLLQLVEDGVLDQVIAVSSGPCPLDDQPGLLEIQVGEHDPIAIPVHGTDGSVVGMVQSTKIHPDRLETAEGVIGGTPTDPPGSIGNPITLDQAIEIAKQPDTPSQDALEPDLTRWRTMVQIQAELKRTWGRQDPLPNARQLRARFKKDGVRRAPEDGGAAHYDMDAAIKAFKTSLK